MLWNGKTNVQCNNPSGVSFVSKPNRKFRGQRTVWFHGKFWGFYIFTCLFFKIRISQSTLKTLWLYRFHGDTVSVTSFIVPVLRLLPFWLPPLIHLWVPISANQTNTHCHSFPSPSQSRRSLYTHISNQPVSAVPPDIPVCRFHFGLSVGNIGAEREMFSHQDRPPLMQEALMWWWWHQDGQNDDKHVTGKQRRDGSLVPQAMILGWVHRRCCWVIPLLSPPLSKVGQVQWVFGVYLNGLAA